MKYTLYYSLYTLYYIIYTILYSQRSWDTLIKQENDRLNTLSKQYQQQALYKHTKNKYKILIQQYNTIHKYTRINAAIKIQSYIRGILCRKHVYTLRAERRVTNALKNLVTELSQPELAKRSEFSPFAMGLDKNILNSILQLQYNNTNYTATNNNQRQLVNNRGEIDKQLKLLYKLEQQNKRDISPKKNTNNNSNTMDDITLFLEQYNVNKVLRDSFSAPPTSTTTSTAGGTTAAAGSGNAALLRKSSSQSILAGKNILNKGSGKVVDTVVKEGIAASTTTAPTVHTPHTVIERLTEVASTILHPLSHLHPTHPTTTSSQSPHTEEGKREGEKGVADGHTSSPHHTIAERLTEAAASLFHPHHHPTTPAVTGEESKGEAVRLALGQRKDSALSVPMTGEEDDGM